jgi:hypothetical protein
MMGRRKINIGKLAKEATSNAFEQAKSTKIPLLLKEGDYLVELLPDGSKRIIKQLPKSKTFIQKHFKMA